MYRLAFVLLVLVIVLSLAGCAGQAAANPTAGSGTLDITMDPVQPSGMDQTLSFHVLDNDKKPVDGATVEIEGNMSMAGMVPVNVTAQGKGNGLYVATIKYTMLGQWSLTVKASARGTSVTKTFPVDVK